MPGKGYRLYCHTLNQEFDFSTTVGSIQNILYLCICTGFPASDGEAGMVLFQNN